ncbi:glycosyltransferase family 2 protein [Lapillicoccus sp.]|uniref:glycosyltransferase family 2 protein n=1 Tax=Lapillicoccus sp. TaxID=1909287 RepID=UPI0025FD1865|nr:glycosyltransferase family 2 protein [Lapillicoccus sp.]
MTSSPTIAVVLASAGRSALLAEALQTCRRQTTLFVGVVSVPDDASLPDDRSLLEGWQVVTGTRGLAAQRNAGLRVLDDEVELVAYFDDDAVLHPDYLRRAGAFMAEHPGVVAMTGRVALDGVTKAEIPLGQAETVLREIDDWPPSGQWRPGRTLYGANFVARTSVARGELFDERLPLYSWLEDHDFARRCLRHGVVAHVDDCVIVHRAAASGGREAHKRLGYSQFMNPWYLWRKGSFPLWLMVEQIFRVLAKNIVRSTGGPESGWRRERLVGNLMGVGDAARGRVTPERIRVL